MAKLSVLLIALSMVLPMAVSANTGNGPFRPSLIVSDEGAWQELLNDADTYRLTDPLGVLPYVRPFGHGEFEVGVETDMRAVACVPPQIPEPTTIILLGVGLLGLSIQGRRRR